MDGLKTIVLAAGEGTRMKSKYSKVLHKILGKTMIEHVIKAAEDAGSDSICIVAGHKMDDVVSALEGKDITFVRQEQLLGTGHAVMQAGDFIGESGTVLVVYGDTPLITGETLKKFIDTHKEKKNAATFMTTEVNDPAGYGRILRESGQFVRVVEHKDATYEQKEIKEINVGIYCFDAGKLRTTLKELKNDNAQGEYYLPDCISILMKNGEKVSPALFEDNSEFDGVNTKAQLAQATKLMQLKINEMHMLNGVNIMSPETTFIEPGVKIGADTLLLPGTILEKGTVIGEDALIGPNSRIINSVIGNGCKVQSSVVIDSEMKDGSDCGPFSYLRPGTLLGERVHIGDFVEIKNTVIGDGTKIPHLTYVGDAEIGKAANLGCGTITANYDGAKKFKTKIGDGAFIGCDTCLIAPVEVGAEAYTASGSVVTEDVPDGALAIGRSRQVNKKGWREKSGKKKA